ncbi:MAG: secondary thiamine-phosphate synthase enzyme YjbQ, partial [Candidatus Zixiibacteriota bacterium]
MKSFSLKTTARNQLVDILAQTQAALDELVREKSTDCGCVVVYCPHTTGAITVNEDYDPDVKVDMLAKLSREIPQDEDYRHAEGNSDSHIKASLIGTSETLIVKGGKVQLGRWQ